MELLMDQDGHPQFQNARTVLEGIQVTLGSSAGPVRDVYPARPFAFTHDVSALGLVSHVNPVMVGGP